MYEHIFIQWLQIFLSGCGGLYHVFHLLLYEESGNEVKKEMCENYFQKVIEGWKRWQRGMVKEFYLRSVKIWDRPPCKASFLTGVNSKDIGLHSENQYGIT
ncbi:hypothetical protein CEXT_672501 [Caerostris extrusa]|uniref:Uncharacterized protein n=1 Tax=Caerostris extrusa TaxID=172846 RepID=A0AAV4PUY7_CAEEX|nr:hypothetical protein CEXT_672501 [Caerostris extrusa]